MLNITYIDGAMLKKLLIAGAKALENNKEQVNALNVFPVPDGDTGTNMSLTLSSASKEILKMNNDNIEDIATSASKGSLMGARGNSGVILSQLFRGFAKGLRGKDKLGIKDIAQAFGLASDTAYKAVMKPIEGTILTVARECAEKAIELSENESDIIVFLEKVLSHGEMVLQKTPEMLDVLKQAGVVDAGGKGLLIILKGAYNVLIGKEDVDINIVHDNTPKQTHEIVTGDIKFGYCTEFIINNAKDSSENFRKQIVKYGDSIIVIGDGDIIKTHIHTNEPGTVLQKALSIGELMDIKIENMRLQHKNVLFNEEDKKENDSQEMKKYGIIAVVRGKGVEDVFRDLNVDYIIEGGQTMNPSTEDILKAVDSLKAENIIILPNNGNIILTAQQVQKISEKNIGIIPTKNIPQGVGALISFDSDLDLDENIECMTEALEDIKSGEVTTAVRDTVINDIEIKEGDIIGIYDGSIVKAGKDLENTSFEMISQMIDEDTDIVTIFYGEDVTLEDAQQLVSKIKSEIDDCDIELVYGGQPLYYYLVSVE
ncbi:DAK2 domain-containing protein [Abyssisolibacter fermentans]|uniref:DAK2 domain-containing protein n=1 Tax=Abyssisolibacter fermentans TaxID=1766203 RepID=UPI00082C8AA4|nr:DAK2 domain-containing protein [Abyssisolibacter fermentans]